MRIFLSYASDDEPQALEIAESIRSRGHKVFVDKTDLPAGATYEDRIENAINRSDAMVFLITPASVTEGRFTLTELGLARERWKQVSGRMLPVMLKATPMDDVPPFLRSVTLLKPEGNAAAEVALAVDHMRRWRPGTATALGLGGAAASAALAYMFFTAPGAEFEFVLRDPSAFERGLFGGPDIYDIPVRLQNSGDLVGTITGLSLEFDPPGALLNVTDRSEQPFLPPEIVLPGSTLKSRFLVSPSDTAKASRWRLCYETEEIGAACSDYRAWSQKGEMLYGDTIPIDRDLARNATAVAWDGEAYLIAADAPARVVRLREDGQFTATADLPGTPMAIATGKAGLYVATTFPDKVLSLDPTSLAPLAEADVRLPPDLEGAFGEPVSQTPVSLALDGTRVWFVTKGGAAGQALAYFDAELNTLTVPPYYDEVSFDLLGLRLRSGTGAIWSGIDNVTPASVYRFTPEAVTELGGHHYDIVSEATDVLPAENGSDIAIPVGSALEQAAVSGDSIGSGRRLFNILGLQSGPDEWPVVTIDAFGDMTGAATTVTRGLVSGGDVTHSTTLTLSTEAQQQELAFEANGAIVRALAVGDTTALLLLENPDGKRQLIASGPR